jgi:two-component system NtrC family sensor kinase
VADVETHLKEIPPVVCHLGSLNQVFLNLIVNAADSIGEVVSGSDRKGRIIIETREEKESDSVVVSIGDDGAGISEDIKDKIFDQFFTTKSVGKGTGQGLAIARKIVATHGGAIWFDSEKGKGTTFFIRLPFGGGGLGPTAPSQPLKVDCISSDDLPSDR